MITIRKADPDDLQTIHDMAQVVFRHTYRDILSLKQMEYMMEMMYSLPNLKAQLDEGHHYYIAYEAEGVPCGYVSVQHEGVDKDDVEVFHLHKIYVMPQFQGRGVGMRLFQTVKDHVWSEMMGEQHSKARIELNVNKHNSAVDFYRHLGMRIIHEEDYPIGNGFYKTDYIMSLDLCPVPSAKQLNFQ